MWIRNDEQTKYLDASIIIKIHDVSSFSHTFKNFFISKQDAVFSFAPTPKHIC